MRKCNPSILQQLTSCYHSYSFPYGKGILLSCALTENMYRQKQRLRYICMLHIASAQRASSVCWNSSSATAKEFSSFYKLLGLRGVLKILL